ncbi:MAG: DUF4870 domain-containing protein [Candidatus Omnitrophica bacterium]|nr:DUF4870 domain-containing protein [Candidatus Omnitrophota bacterium]
MSENEQRDLGTTDTGIKPNVEALLAYLLCFVTGLIFVLIEKNNKFVRFHAMQSIIVFGSIFILQWIISFIPGLGVLVSGLLSLAGVALWIILMVKAYQGEKFKLPWAGDLAEKNA